MHPRRRSCRPKPPPGGVCVKRTRIVWRGLPRCDVRRSLGRARWRRSCQRARPTFSLRARTEGQGRGVSRPPQTFRHLGCLSRRSVRAIRSGRRGVCRAAPPQSTWRTGWAGRPGRRGFRRSQRDPRFYVSVPVQPTARLRATDADAGSGFPDRDRGQIDRGIGRAAFAARQVGQGAAHAAALSSSTCWRLVSRSAAFWASLAALKIRRLSSFNARNQLLIYAPD